VQCPGTQRLAQRRARAQARTRAASGRCTWSCQTITRTSRHPSALSTGYTTRTWMKCVPALCHACACGACGLHGRGVLSRRCAHAGRGRYASTSSTRPGAPCSVRAPGRPLPLPARQAQHQPAAVTLLVLSYSLSWHCLRGVVTRALASALARCLACAARCVCHSTSEAEHGCGARAQTC